MRVERGHDQEEQRTEDAGASNTHSAYKRAIFDIVLLALVFWPVWSLRFLGVPYIGALTMAAGLTVTGLILRWRRQKFVDIGLAREDWNGRLRSRALGAMAVIGLTALVVGSLVSAVLGRPSTSSAVTQLPENPWLFLLDITLVTWLLVALGEEVFFRGILLNRLLVVTGEGKGGRIAAIVVQAAWFGGGHASQGVSGMLITGAIGLMLGFYFLTKAERRLLPLILAHGAIDTISLSLAWFTR